MMARREPPAERMLRLAAYVEKCGKTGCTRAEIAEDVPGYGSLGTSALEKQLGRDRSELTECFGIRIDWSDERQRYLIEPPYFTSGERAALIAAAAAVDVKGVGEEFGKGELGTAVEQDTARVVVAVHSRVLELRDAIADRRTIRFRYNGRERTFDPYVIGMWRTRWYLRGHDHDRGERGNYRLDRIELAGELTAITPTSAPHAYEIPSDIDPIAELRMDPNAWGTDPPLIATVRVARDQVPMFLGELDATILSTDRDGAVVELEVRDYESFVVRLLGFGPNVRLLEPAGLVTLLRTWLTAQRGVG